MIGHLRQKHPKLIMQSFGHSSSKKKKKKKTNKKTKIESFVSFQLCSIHWLDGSVSYQAFMAGYSFVYPNNATPLLIQGLLKCSK